MYLLCFGDGGESFQTARSLSTFISYCSKREALLRPARFTPP